MEVGFFFSRDKPTFLFLVVTIRAELRTGYCADVSKNYTATVKGLKNKMMAQSPFLPHYTLDYCFSSSAPIFGRLEEGLLREKKPTKGPPPLFMSAGREGVAIVLPSHTRGHTIFFITKTHPYIVFFHSKKNHFF